MGVVFCRLEAVSCPERLETLRNDGAFRQRMSRKFYALLPLGGVATKGQGHGRIPATIHAFDLCLVIIPQEMPKPIPNHGSGG